MPKLVHSSQFIDHSRKRSVNCQLSGFTLVEILLSVFLILAIVSILFTAASTYVTSRGTNLAGVAAKIASRQIETLRKTAYDSLPASGSFTDPDLAKLPQGQADQTLSDYQSSTDIKQVLVEIFWTENAAQKQVKMETLIYRYGL